MPIIAALTGLRVGADFRAMGMGSAETAIHRHPVRTIVDFVRDNDFDLLVVGATGHSGLYETMIGSRAERLVHLTPYPVVVVK